MSGLYEAMAASLSTAGITPATSAPAAPETAPVAAPVAEQTAAPSEATAAAPAAFPSPAPAPSTESTPATRPNASDPLAVPNAVAELRKDPTRRWFPAEHEFSSTSDALRELVGASGAKAEHIGAEVTEWQRVFQDHGLNSRDADMLLNLSKTVSKTPVDDAQVDEWSQTSLQRLSMKYGDRADSLLADARRLAARDPRVSKYLLETGLGSHPEVVSMFVSKAQAQRLAGKLK